MTLRLTFILFTVVLGIRGFAQFTHPPYHQYTLRDGLPQMQVMSIFQDSRGYIWTGTKGGVGFFDGEKFTSFKKKDGLANEYINVFAEDDRKRVWIGTRDGLVCYDGKKMTSYPDGFYCDNIIADPLGKIWFQGTIYPDKFIFGYFENGKYTYLQEIFKGVNLLDSPELDFSEIEKTILINTPHLISEVNGNKNTILLNSSDSIVRVKYGNIVPTYAIMQNKLNFRILEYHSGHLDEVANIRNGKISGNNLLKHTITFSPLLTFPPIYTVTPDTVILENYYGIQKNCYLLDHEKHLWIGSEEGLFQLYDNGFTTYKKEYLPQVWSVMEDAKGNMWFASFHFGLKKFDGKKIKSLPEITHNGQQPTFYFHPSIDKRGEIYFPDGWGMLVYDGNKFDTINWLGCLTSYYDKERDLIWGNKFKKVVVYSPTLKTSRTISELERMDIGNNVVCIRKDIQGKYWFGGGAGIARYNWESGLLVEYNKKNGKLPADGVVTIHNDYNGRTWFGSKNGLLWYDSKTDSILKIEKEEISDEVAMVSSVDSTWLLVSQPYGIYLMDLQKYYKTGQTELYLYNEKNGFQGIEPGQDGGFTDSKGNVWMTTSTEVVKLDPKKLKPEKHLLNVRIEKLNGKPLPFNTNTIELPRNQNSAVITFGAICFNRPNPVQYSWKMENDTVWSAWQEENYAVITGLDDGSTKIAVRVKIAGLPLTYVAQTDLVLQIRMALYRQAWFFPTLLAIVSLLVIIALLLLVQTRTKMLQINRQAKTFQLQATLSQMNPHFIFNVMASLQSMILSANIEKANNYLVRMSDLVRGFLEASLSTSSSGSKKLRNGEMSLKSELKILQAFVEFQQLIYPGRFDYKLTIDPRINPEQITIPPMLIQPFIENAIRHGLLQKEGHGLLELKISVDENGSLLVIISDDGIGIKKAGEIMKKSPLLYTSRGRELTEKRIKLLNEIGYRIIYRTDSSGQGTTVTLNLNKHES